MPTVLTDVKLTYEYSMSHYPSILNHAKLHVPTNQHEVTNDIHDGLTRTFHLIDARHNDFLSAADTCR